jgi:hypothetical protein
MPRYDIHLCLVSAQATPNLLPVLDDQWRPRRVVLAASPQMRSAAIALQTVIKQKGTGVEVQILDLPDAYDYEALSEAFLEFLVASAGESVALNVTGGTKLMAVAAQEAFRANDQPVMYVNVESDEVIVIGQGGRSQPLQARMKVRELLVSHGFAIEAQLQPQVPRELRDLAARVIDHVGSAGGALGQLNLLASQAKARPHFEVVMTERQLDSRSLGAMLALFEDAGQLSTRGPSLQFPNEAARSFVNGGWLELHVFNALQDLRGHDSRISDVVMNAQVLHPDGKTRNEADIAFLCRNTLHLIECKTANLANEGAGGDDKATEAIYKMEALLKLGGLRTRGMIVDYRGALSAHKPNLDRARSAGIEVIAGTQLRDLKGHLSRQWLAR